MLDLDRFSGLQRSEFFHEDLPETFDLGRCQGRPDACAGLDALNPTFMRVTE
jgi:hypothetical protein